MDTVLDDTAKIQQNGDKQGCRKNCSTIQEEEQKGKYFELEGPITVLATLRDAVVSSTYEERSSNWRQYVSLMVNDKKLALKPTNYTARTASGDDLKLEGELDRQVYYGDQKITAN
ncbi:hypothetical protein ACTXT7_016931 [Hymenolepis weldensis]